MEQNIELVKLAKTGDPHAFAQLYECVYKDLYRFAFISLRSREDAEDVVGETVLDAFTAIGGLRREEAFRAWIFRILSNKCKDKLKEYTQKYVDWEEVENELSYSEEWTESVYLRKLFGELGDEERLIVGLHVFGGYTSREIAGMLHMKANTVRTRESRALKKLAARMRAAEVERNG